MPQQPSALLIAIARDAQSFANRGMWDGVCVCVDFSIINVSQTNTTWCFLEREGSSLGSPLTSKCPPENRKNNVSSVTKFLWPFESLK